MKKCHDLGVGGFFLTHTVYAHLIRVLLILKLWFYLTQI